MKYFYLIILFQSVFAGCREPEIQQVIIVKYNESDYHKNNAIKITGADTLSLIRGLFDNKKAEPLVFMITYNLRLLYTDGSTKEYSGQGKYIRDKKGSYILPSDKRLETFLELVK